MIEKINTYFLYIGIITALFGWFTSVIFCFIGYAIILISALIADELKQKELNI